MGKALYQLTSYAALEHAYAGVRVPDHQINGRGIHILGNRPMVVDVETNLVQDYWSWQAGLAASSFTTLMW